MKLKEKYHDYLQRKEAKAYFNRNNNEKVYGKDYLIAFVVGLITSVVLGLFLEGIVSIIHFNFSYFTIFVGVLQAIAIKKSLNKSGQQLAIIAVITFVLGVTLAQTIHVAYILPFVNINMFISLFIECFKGIFISDFFSLIVYIFGAIASYTYLKD